MLLEAAAEACAGATWVAVHSPSWLERGLRGLSGQCCIVVRVLKVDVSSISLSTHIMRSRYKMCHGMMQLHRTTLWSVGLSRGNRTGRVHRVWIAGRIVRAGAIVTCGWCRGRGLGLGHGCMVPLSAVDKKASFESPINGAITSNVAVGSPHIPYLTHHQTGNCLAYLYSTGSNQSLLLVFCGTPWRHGASVGKTPMWLLRDTQATPGLHMR
jgi:hypothetical protein